MWLTSTFLLCAIALASTRGNIITRSNQIDNQSSGPKKVVVDEKVHQYERDIAGSNAANEIQLVYDYLESGQKRMQNDTRYEDVVLVLGNTGSGKSTIVQLLAGNNSNLISEKKCYVFKNKTRCEDDFKITDTNNKIGSNTINSHIKVPERVFDSNTNTTFYDCPPFNRYSNSYSDLKHDIGGTYFIKKVIDNAKAVKFVFVVDYFAFTDMDKGNFMQLAKHATSLIQNITKFNDSIAMVATKVNDREKTDREIISVITGYLVQVYEVLENNKNSSITDKKIMQFIDILLTSVNDNNDFPRIGLFRQVTKPGPLSNIIEVQENKKFINNILHNNIKYIKHDNADDFDYTISDMRYQARIYINGFVRQINENILFDAKNISNKLTKYYNNLTENMINKIDSVITDDDAIIVSDTAYSFLTKLDTAFNTIFTLVKEINNATTPKEFSNKITHSINILNIPISISDSTSDILLQGQHLDFFRDLAKPNTLLHQKELQSCFRSLILTLAHLKCMLLEKFLTIS